MKRILLLFLLLIIVVGCTSAEQKPASEVTTSSNLTEAVANTTSACVARWDCTSSTEKAFLTEDCQWINKTKCELGCREGDCEIPPTCIEGWGCLNEKKRGYKNSDCSWSNEYDCDYGCAETLCRLEPLNETVEEPTPVVTISNQDKFITLEQGQTNQHTAGEKTYNVTLYFITDEKIKLDIDGDKTNWIYEGDNYQYQDLNLTINSIIYSSYGIKQIEYSIN